MEEETPAVEGSKERHQKNRRRRHPFQCIAHVKPQAPGQSSLLLLAYRLFLLVVDLRTGSIVATWDAEKASSRGMISMVAVNHAGDVVALVTSEDKAVHILSISSDGLLTSLNKRVLPKRPSCICWTRSGKNLLAGDKFGDVYNLPLHTPTPQEASTIALEQPNMATETPSQPSTETPAVITGDEVQGSTVRGFKPSATELTVHSGRNRRALENQQRTAAGKHDQKKEVDASLQVVLGHVSMLTALICCRVPTGRAIDGADTFYRSSDQITAWQKELDDRHYRDYIITADRDEHIRISRGLPQAHIIENYCLGHTSFVSALCIPEQLETANLLFSGGGDDWIGCWNWLRGELICQIPIQIPDMTEKRFAISKMWSFPPDNNMSIKVVITFEGLHQYCLVQSKSPTPTSANDFVITIHQVAGKVLDIINMDSSPLLLSLDHMNLRQDGSGNSSVQQTESRVVIVSGNNASGQASIDIDQKITEAMSQQNIEHKLQDKDESLINDLFYGTERLRKQAEYGDD